MIVLAAGTACVEEPRDGAANDAVEQVVVVVDAEPAQPTFQIGEPVWVDLFVTNTGAVEVQGTVMNVFGMRDELHVEAVGPDGRRIPDPFRYERVGMVAGAPWKKLVVRPGGSGALRIDLTKYAWFDAPGAYDVRFVAPVHPGSASVRTRVEIVEPTDLEALARIGLGAGDDWRPAKTEVPITDRNTFESLGHAVFVPVLEALAVAGGYTTADDRWVSVRESAVQAIAACPCVEATEALIRLHDREPDPGGVATRELLRRIPGPTLPNDWFVARVSTPAVGDAIRERARAALEVPTSDSSWAAAYEWGGEVLARIGTPPDGVLAVEALDRALAMPDGTSGKVDAVQMLGWAVHVHPAQPTGLGDDAALLAEVLRCDGRTGQPPAGWEEVVLRALASGEVAVLEHMMDRLPHDASAEVVAALVPHVGSPDGSVGKRLYRYVAKHPPDAALLVGPLRRELSGPPSPRTVGILHVLKLHVALDEWLELVLAAMIADPTRSDLALLVLGGLSGCRGTGHAGVDPAEIPSLVAAWETVLRTERAALRAGPMPIVPGVTDPALVPRSYGCTLSSGEPWPAR